MLHQKLLFVLVAFCLALAQSLDNDDLSCDDIGFDAEKIHCSNCDVLKKHVKDTKLVSECYDCCVEDRKRYGKAALHVCQQGLKQMEEIKNFIEKDAEQFSKLEVQYEKPQMYMGMAMCGQPSLKMKDDEGAIQDTVEINGWKQDQLREFLESKLMVA